MTSDKTEPETPKTSEQTFDLINQTLNHLFEQGDKFHRHCKMLGEGELHNAFHTFIKAYNFVGETCAAFLKLAREGNAEAPDLMAVAMMDMNGFVTLLSMFDNALSKAVSIPGSEVSGSHTYT